MTDIITLFSGSGLLLVKDLVRLSVLPVEVLDNPATQQDQETRLRTEDIQR